MPEWEISFKEYLESPELADALKRRNAEPIETSHKGLRMI